MLLYHIYISYVNNAVKNRCGADCLLAHKDVVNLLQNRTFGIEFYRASCGQNAVNICGQAHRRKAYPERDFLRALDKLTCKLRRTRGREAMQHLTAIAATCFALGYR